MKKRVLTVMAGLCALAAQALTVQAPSSPITVDGKLNEPAWQNATKTSNFIRMKSQTGTPVKDQTSFSVLADEDAVYLGITCYDSDMASAVWNGSIWQSDAIEMFLSPAGNSVEYYHFAVGLSNDRYSMYHAEGGNIRPDKFAPFWENATSKDDKAWYLEVKIPYSAFYMTPNKMWNKQWLLNITRTQTHKGGLSTWAPLFNGFHESKVFKPVDGFPMRKALEDIKIPVVIGNFLAQEDGFIIGDVTVNIEGTNGSQGKWDMTVEVPNGNKQTMPVNVEYGNHKYIVKGLKFPAAEKGYHQVKVTLKRGDVELGRFYPVKAEYNPLAIKITYPQYANNFYMGQDAGKVAGRITFKLTEADLPKGKIELKIGDKVHTYKSLKDTIVFEEKIKGLKEGSQLDISARLLVDGKDFAQCNTVVKRLAPPQKGNAVWIQDGHIVLNGKPYFPRSIYAYGYRGGTHMAERFKNEQDYLCMNNFACPTLEPERLIKGIEPKEATKDVKPCKEMYDKVQAVIDANREKDIIGYYLCDEPECRNISPVYLKYIYDFVKEQDPYHPIFSCTRSPQTYIECFDVFMMHTYISPMYSGDTRILSRPIDDCRAQIHEVTDFKRPEKVAGFTGQFFSYKFNNKYADYPTWDELLAQSWTTVANGSKVSNPYAYHDINDRSYMLEAFAYLNQCFMELNDWLLSDNISYLDIQADKKLDCTLFENDGIKVLLMVNPFPETFTATVNSKAIKGTWYEFRGDKVLKLKAGQPIAFAPYQVYLYTSKKINSKFADTKDILAKNAAAEQAIKTKGNLFLGKGSDIEIDASEIALVNNAKIKAFDGSLDMLAWESNRWRKQQWFEMDFPKVSPLFSKLKIYGYTLKNPSFQIWKAGEWKDLPIIEQQENADEWSKTFTFDKQYKTVKIRINFNDLKVGEEHVEIYEVEAY